MLFKASPHTYGIRDDQIQFVSIHCLGVNRFEGSSNLRAGSKSFRSANHARGCAGIWTRKQKFRFFASPLLLTLSQLTETHSIIRKLPGNKSTDNAFHAINLSVHESHKKGSGLITQIECQILSSPFLRIIINKNIRMELRNVSMLSALSEKMAKIFMSMCLGFLDNQIKDDT